MREREGKAPRTDHQPEPPGEGTSAARPCARLARGLHFAHKRNFISCCSSRDSVAQYASPMLKSSILGSLSLSIFLACGGGVQSVPDAGNNNQNNNDAAAQPDTSMTTVDAAPDVDNGAPSSTYPAFKIDAPQVINVTPGPVLTTPKVVPVYFGNDDTSMTSQITTFLSKLPMSAYWGPSLTEYGVGALTVATPIQLTESALASIDDTAIQTWLQGKLTSDDPAWPAPDANTIYALFYPSTTTITLQGSTSCSAFGGYHNDTVINTSTNISYAVVPRCGSFGSLMGIDAVTAPASHEIIEASTDPYPTAAQAYGTVDDDHIIWEFLLGGGEVGDMCAQFQTSFYTPTDLGFSVQRTWSNLAASGGHDPCMPSDGTPYFNSMPVLTDTVNIGGQVMSKGINIPVGQTGTVEIDLFSDAPTSGPWTVTAEDAAKLEGAPSTLSLSLDRPKRREAPLDDHGDRRVAVRRRGVHPALAARLASQHLVRARRELNEHRAKAPAALLAAGERRQRRATRPAAGRGTDGRSRRAAS
jgi:hypothetical protein